MSPAEAPSSGCWIRRWGQGPCLCQVRASYVLTPEAHLCKGKRQQALGKIGRSTSIFCSATRRISFPVPVELDDEGTATRSASRGISS